MREHDYDKIVALLKSVAAPCESSKKSLEHSWRRFRHCLAVAELEHAGVRAALSAFIESIEITEQGYGHGV
jgi:hypothetical protein